MRTFLKGELRAYGSPLVDFLSNNNTVILKDREEIEAFVKQMECLGIDCSILLDEVPSKIFEQGLLVEYDNYRGVTWWNGKRSYPTMEDALKASREWFNEQPFNFKDICII